MKLFKPSLYVNKITDVKFSTLKKMQVKAIFLDVDNTLCSYRSKEPLEGAIEWVERAKRKGYKVYIVSNNYKKRVSAVAGKYKLPFVSFALKPLPFGFSRASSILELKKDQCVIIGDQIFTDVLGANFAGMKSVLVEPIEPENGLIGIRRYFEKDIKRNLEKVIAD